MELEKIKNELKTLENRNNFLSNESAILKKHFDRNKLIIEGYLKEIEENKSKIIKLEGIYSKFQ